MIDSRAEQTSEKAAKVELNKSRQTAKLFDKSNALIGFYPATIGSEEKPFPSGTLKVTEIDRTPTYRYNPAYHSAAFTPSSRSPSSRARTILSMWINLSGDGYGVHGTPIPGEVSSRNSTAASGSRIGMPSVSRNGLSKGTPVEFVDRVK
ncbi:lipoprotein-anchoring transpeptidase ErfK/SrfK [Bradyrhizobium sp. GM5.1]